MYRNPSGNASRISAKTAILSTSPLFPVRMTSRVRATGLDYTMEHPASSRRMATVHRTVAFTWVRVHRLYQNKKGARRLLFILVRVFITDLVLLAGTHRFCQFLYRKNIWKGRLATIYRPCYTLLILLKQRNPNITARIFAFAMGSSHQFLCQQLRLMIPNCWHLFYFLFQFIKLNCRKELP